MLMEGHGRNVPAQVEVQLPPPAVLWCWRHSSALLLWKELLSPWPHWFPIASQYVSRKDVGLEGKIIFFLYLLLVLSCCTVSRGCSGMQWGPSRASSTPRLTLFPSIQLLYHRVQRRCRRDAAAPLLMLERDGFAGRSTRSVSRVSHYFQLVFLLCWAPGESGWECATAPVPAFLCRDSSQGQDEV